MIRIQTIRITKFRGIRELELNLVEESFGICGPNGTGKSGIVDSIEFALTGDISRLSGRGTGDLSVRAHGPHVDDYKNPEKAKVELTAFIPSLGKSATISRSVATPTNYDLTPDDPEIRQVFEELQIHPEFALSRREIIRYILATPNDRAADVQELLRLAEVETVRKSLTTVANTARVRRNQKQQNRLTEQKALLQIFKIEKMELQRVLDSVNENRAVLALAPLDVLDATTVFKHGVPEVPKASVPVIKKADAQADLAALGKLRSEGEPAALSAKRASALEAIQSLIDDAESLRGLKQRSLINAGIDLVDADNCPLCDKEWEREALLQHLTAKLEGAKRATELLNTLNEDINHVIAGREGLKSLLGRVLTLGPKFDPAVDVGAIKTLTTGIEAGTAPLRKFVSHTNNIIESQQTLEQEWWVLPPDAQENIKACASSVADLPEISKADQARDFLTRAEDQYRRSVAARIAFDVADEQSTIAARALEIYNIQSDAILGALYDEVAGDFTDYYRSLNREDEGEFEAKLIPSSAKLGFDVDFYGRGRFPPGAYHSEGHQDGMGLCLYLALMKRTLGDKFSFCVLDDVLMSIDADHRREVCKLLKRDFPDTQFILTTHDRMWLKFMHTEGLVKHSVSFSDWTPETGPKIWQHLDVWEEIEDALQKNDIEVAAGRLRHYLEYITSVLADNLHAKVIFKGDGRYDLGDLMQPVINRWQKKLGDAIKAANSWNKGEVVTKLSALKAKLEEARARTQVEQWAINPAVHYNKWANIQANEFRQVVSAFADLLATMQCNTCKSFVELLPRNKQAEIICCNCGELAINLKRKAA